MIDEVLLKVESGEVSPVEVDLAALMGEVRGAEKLEEWSEKMSKLLRLVRLKIRALVTMILRLSDERPSSFDVALPLSIPWVSLGEAEGALKSLLDVMSRRGRAGEEGGFFVEGKEAVELHLAGDERRHREKVLEVVRGPGRVRLEGLLEGDVLKRISIFVEILRLITEGVLRYDKATGEVYL